MKRTYYIFYFALLLCCYSCNRSAKYRPVVNNGYVDLSGWDFNKNGIFTLNGTWEFYWNKLYSPQDFEKDSLAIKPDYIKVPGFWNSLVVDDKNLPGFGYGTYRLRIKLNPANKKFGIKLQDFSSAYKLWINGDLIATNGHVSSVLTEVIPQLRPQVKTFSVESDQMELVVQIANNFHPHGGMWYSTQIGTQEQITATYMNSFTFTVFFIGAVFVLFIYHIWIFLLRKKQILALWFSLLCLFIIFRTLVINDRILYFFFPDFSLNIGYRIEYVTIFSLLPNFFALFFFNLFGIRTSKIGPKIIFGISSLVFILILLSPTQFYTSIVIPFQIFTYSVFIYFLILASKQVVKRKKDAVLFLILGIACTLSGINDILYLNLIIDTFQISHFVFAIFLLINAYILASRNAGAYNEIEDLSFNLEKKVVKRTQELEAEKIKSDNLLLNILPAEVAEELKQKGQTTPKTFNIVTVMFTDFKDFTKVSENVSAEALVEEIHHCFTGFDNIVQKYGIEKIKTIGDAYMCVGGMPLLSNTDAMDTVNAAIEIRDFIANRKIEKETRGEIPFEIRIGIHTGSVVAGIVGVKKFAYDIWGDTVNIAARMESSSEGGKVNISGSTYELVKDKFNCTYRGKIEAKNKGKVDMYFVENY